MGSDEGKVKKSRLVAVIKRKLEEKCFYNGKKPTVTKNLWYNTTFKETNQMDELRLDTNSGLKDMISPLLNPMWPLNFYGVPLALAT